EGRHHRNSLQADDMARLADLPHPGIQQLGRTDQGVLLLRRAIDLIVLVENANVDGVVAHGGAQLSTSRFFRRPIMASTRERARSFFSISLLRSLMRALSRSRRERFSACSRAHAAIRRSSFCSSCCRLVSAMGGG